MNLKRGEVGSVVSPLRSLSPECSPAGQHGTEPEMSRVTHSTLTRWPRIALFGKRCEGSGARRSRWLPAQGTAVKPCKGRSGSTKAKPHGSTPRQKQMKPVITDFSATWGQQNEL